MDQSTLLSALLSISLTCLHTFTACSGFAKNKGEVLYYLSLLRYVICRILQKMLRMLYQGSLNSRGQCPSLVSQMSCQLDICF